MRFIKEYKLFEDVNFNHSDDDFINSINSKIEDIFSPRNEDGYMVNIRTSKSRLNNNNIIVDVEIYQVSRHNRRDIIFFRIEDIFSQLDELIGISNHSDINIMGSFVEQNGMVTVRLISLNDLIKYYLSALNSLRIRLVVNKNSTIFNRCSNPECDNILDKGDTKCPVCGENQ